MKYKTFEELKEELVNHIVDLEKYSNEDKKEIRNLKQENKQLKEAYDKEKYLTDKLTKQITDEYKNTEYQTNKAKGLENQQKEFIKYLEDEINKLVKEYGNYVYDDYSEEKGKYDSYQEILQKYKEIIGDDK